MPGESGGNRDGPARIRRMSPEDRKGSSPSRQLAFYALRDIERGGYADVVLHRHLERGRLTGRDRALATELVYGVVRRQRTLDTLLDQLGTKPAHQQPWELRLAVQLGLYQLRYLDQIPAAAAINTSVELVKGAGLPRLAGVVNGILRQYQRQAQGGDPLVLPGDPGAAVALRHSLPDWLVALWQAELGLGETEALGDWLNRPPYLDLRVNPLRTTVAAVQAALEAQGVVSNAIAGLPQGLRVLEGAGDVRALAGYDQGHWVVQDASAQMVSLLVDPQPGNCVVDACAAPGGKATHLAELMGDQGIVWACDRTPSRLKKVQQACDRLGLTAVKSFLGDSTHLEQFQGQADRVLIDAPCSGLGTLHRHADARWRQTPATIADLIPLQRQLLAQGATWVKPGGTLVYATCTLNPTENEVQVQRFLETHPDWTMPPLPPALAPYGTPEGWVKVWPHRHDRDGFFMVRFQRPPGD